MGLDSLSAWDTQTRTENPRGIRLRRRKAPTGCTAACRPTLVVDTHTSNPPAPPVALSCLDTSVCTDPPAVIIPVPESERTGPPTPAVLPGVQSAATGLRVRPVVFWVPELPAFVQHAPSGACSTCNPGCPRRNSGRAESAVHIINEVGLSNTDGVGLI